MGLVNKVWEGASHEAFMRQVIEYAHEFTPPGKARDRGRAASSAPIQSGLEMASSKGSRSSANCKPSSSHPPTPKKASPRTPKKAHVPSQVASKRGPFYTS